MYVHARMRAWLHGRLQVEDCGVATVGGFESRQRYYEEASSLQYLPHIRTPTLLLLAKDDPFLG